MTTAVLHDPLRGTTPSQRLAAAAHAMRQARIKAVAVADTPIVCPSRLPIFEIEQLPPAPAFDFDKWLERQNKAHPLPKEPWFSVDRDLGPVEPIRPTVDKIQRAVVRHYRLTMTDFLSARRTDVLVRPRQIAMYLVKSLTLRTLPEIGRRFGGRDHTTVLHAVRKIERLLKSDPVLAEEVSSIMTKLAVSQ